MLQKGAPPLLYWPAIRHPILAPASGYPFCPPAGLPFSRHYDIVLGADSDGDFLLHSFTAIWQKRLYKNALSLALL